MNQKWSKGHVFNESRAYRLSSQTFDNNLFEKTLRYNMLLQDSNNSILWDMPKIGYEVLDFELIDYEISFSPRSKDKYITNTISYVPSTTLIKSKKGKYHNDYILCGYSNFNPATNLFVIAYIKRACEFGKNNKWDIRKELLQKIEKKIDTL